MSCIEDRLRRKLWWIHYSHPSNHSSDQKHAIHVQFMTFWKHEMIDCSLALSWPWSEVTEQGQGHIHHQFGIFSREALPEMSVFHRQFLVNYVQFNVSIIHFVGIFMNDDFNDLHFQSKTWTFWIWSHME